MTQCIITNSEIQMANRGSKYLTKPNTLSIICSLYLKDKVGKRLFLCATELHNLVALSDMFLH